VKRLRPTSKATVVLLALLGALVVLVSGSRDWVRGTVQDPLGTSQIVGTGTQVASGLAALALVGAAAALASATSGRVVRRVALAVLAVSALGLGFLAGRVLRDPSGVMGSVAARAMGRTGSVETHVSVTVWPGLCLVAALLLLVAAVGGWVGAASWRGLGARYEAQGATATGARGQRVASDWDRLDAGDDPTAPAPSPRSDPDPT
jgi:uncharacterized membrane protein (TIGR02234 family)